MSQPDWNYHFNNLIRSSYPQYWGNWSLLGEVKVGAIGIISPDGTFTSTHEEDSDVAKVIAKNVRQRPSSEHRFEISSSSVRYTEVMPEVSGPVGEIPATARLEANWELAKKFSISSKCALTAEHYLADSDSLLEEQQPALARIASRAGYCSDGINISQGFGVVTEVIYAQSGVNLGSTADNAHFAISGHVSSLHEFLGVDAGGGGSFDFVKEERNISKMIWPPGKQTSSASTERPILYSFTSFDKKTLLPNWIGKVGSLQLSVRNHSSYIIYCTLEYLDQETGKHVTQEGTTLASFDIGFGNISRYAKDLTLKLEFQYLIDDNPVFTLAWDNPAALWKGQPCKIYCQGIYPAPPSASQDKPSNWNGDYFLATPSISWIPPLKLE